jgi:DNA-binding winged helix-turn-helix (wHTH) protein
MRLRISITLSLAVLAVTGLLYGFINRPEKFEQQSRILTFRRIGHEFLLSASDSTSRVLSVKMIGETTYQIEFEQPFAFLPDSLVTVVRHVMAQNDIAKTYIVSVIDKSSNVEVYAFKIAKNGKHTIPCIGRSLPRGNYGVNIVLPESSTPMNYSFAAIGALGLSFVGGVSIFRHKRKNAFVSASFKIGQYVFYPDSAVLEFKGEKDGLTDKECMLMKIFSVDMNKVIDRNQLLKQGWEDEGVITTRSLDMYVSRLRKKLEKDTTVSIANIHGKGYSLKTMSS